MRDRGRSADQFEALISELEHARKGSAELDVMTVYWLGKVPPGSRRAANLLVEKGFEWRMIANLWDTEIPAYTRSLDAGVPGENIVATLRMENGGWAAVQRLPGGADIIGRGATEALARRAAAVKGLAQEVGVMGDAASPEPSQAARSAGRGRGGVGNRNQSGGEGDPVVYEESEWKVRF